MAEEKPTLHVDTDWKKQAQEEKRRLAEEEEEKRRPAAAPAASAVPGAGGAAMTGAPPGAPAAAAAAARGRELPPATFETLVQSIVTQVLYYLGDLQPRGGEPMLNLDMAKHNIDLLAMLEQKTAGNLSDQEKRLLDSALYEVRMRYVNVASQFLG